MNFKLNTLLIELIKENNDVRLKTDDDCAIFKNQNIEKIESLVIQNFNFVNAYYSAKKHSMVDDEIIDLLCLRIVVHYLYMYNMWKNDYLLSKWKSLKFKKSDFKHPATTDIVIDVCKKRFPENWKHICSKLMMVSEKEFDEIYESRKLHWNR